MRRSRCTRAWPRSWCCGNKKIPLPQAGGARGGPVSARSYATCPPPTPPASGRGDASPNPIRHHVAPVGIDQYRTIARREGALVAVVARTDAARQTDARRGLRCRDIDPVGIDEVGGLLRPAPGRAGVAARAASVASRWLHPPLRHRHVAPALGLFGAPEHRTTGG